MHPAHVVITFEGANAFNITVFSSYFGLDIMNNFHFDLSCPCSYHHIPYVLYIEVQHALCIRLALSQP